MAWKDKVAVITGGASGIGKAAADLIGGHGATVVIADVQEEKGKKITQELAAQKVSAQFVKTDVANMNSIKALFSKTIADYHKVDFLVNCAGICNLTPLLEITPREWDKIMAVNLNGTFFCCQEAMRNMCASKFGRIITISSMAAKLGGVVVGAHYSASKAAIMCITKSLALYGAQYNVNVNCVCPGPIATPITDEWGDEMNAEFAVKIPLKRYGTPAEVAHAIGFLLSEQAGYITGEIIDVNGGMLMD